MGWINIIEITIWPTAISKSQIVKADGDCSFLQNSSNMHLTPWPGEELSMTDLPVFYWKNKRGSANTAKVFWAGIVFKVRVDISAKPAAVAERRLSPCSAAGLNMGQGSPLPSLPSATSLLSCLIQSKLACRGLFSYRSPVNKDFSVGPPLTHSAVGSARLRARGVNTDPGTLQQLQIITIWSLACVYELSTLVWHHCCGDMTACRCSVWIALQCFLLNSPPQYETVSVLTHSS